MGFALPGSSLVRPLYHQSKRSNTSMPPIIKVQSKLHVRAALHGQPSSRIAHCSVHIMQSLLPNKKPKVEYDCSSHLTLKKSSSPFAWCSPPSGHLNDPQVPNTYKNRRTHEPIPRIPERQTLCGGSSRSTPMIREDIFENQLEREYTCSEISKGRRKPP